MEVEWILYESCQCTLPYDFSVQDSYFACATSDYVIFRAKLSERDSLNAVYLPSLKANLSRLLARADKTQITINGVKFFIEPGPCGLTIPEFTSPHCLDSTPTQQAAATTSPQNNTVTTVVAIMSAALVLLVLGGCIIVLVIGLRKRYIVPRAQRQ